MKVLDLGCGRGQGSYELKKRFGKDSKVFGIDLERENIKRARDRFGKEGEFILAKGERIPFEKDYFDLVSSVEVLEHVTDLGKTIQEVARVLKKGGIFVATFPNKESEKELVKLNKDYLKQIGHKRIIDLEDFKELSRKEFSIKRIKIYNSVEHLYWRFLFKRGYKIISENGDLNKPAPRLLTLFEKTFNPDKKDINKGFVHWIVGVLNGIFSKVSFLFDLFFPRKRVKIIMVKD